MTTSTQYLLTGPHTIDRRERVLTGLSPTWVRVRILHCAVCGSDLSMFEGRRPLSFPHSLGHEFVGVVEAIGANVTTVRVGDMVTSDLNLRCGSCAACQRGESHLCVFGQDGLFTNRAFADHLDLASEYLLLLGVDCARQLALVEPLSCVLHALSWACAGTSDRILVVGAGGLGLCAAFGLAAVSPQVTFELIDRIPERVGFLVEAAGGSARSCAEVEPAAYDVVVDLSGSVGGLRLACDAVRRGGRLVSMSHLDGYGPTTFLLPALTRRDVEFKLSYLNGERANLEAAALMLATGWTDAWSAAISFAPLRSLQNVLERDRGSVTCKTIIDFT